MENGLANDWMFNKKSPMNFLKSEAIDTDQSVALMIAKVTIDTDRWKVRNGNIY